MAEKSLREAAIEYAKCGFDVFPVIPLGKHPATDNGFKNATRDLEQVKKWWSENPNYNIAIRTGGKSHLTVVDVDVDKDNGKFGNEHLRKWERENAPLPETVSAITPRGGAHYYFLADDEYRNRTNIIENVDVRGEGGYVLAPPSVVEYERKDGSKWTGQYEWEHDPLDPEEEVTYARVSRGSAIEKFLTQALPRQPSASEVKEVGKFPEGQRTDGLMKAIGKAIDDGFTTEGVKALIRIENEQRCEPPLTDEELEQQIFPALERGWLPTHPYTETRVRTDLPNPVDLCEILQDPPPLDPVLIDGVLRRGHKMLISGPSKAGKSFALAALAICIAEGREWFGSLCAVGKVLYINMEITDSSCYDRFAKIYNEMHIDKPHGNITVWGLRGYSMPLSKLAPQIIGYGKGFAAIIIDPLYKVMEGADENSNSDVAKMVGYFDQIARETGASVIYAHHFAKGNAGDRNTIDRGSGAGTFSRDPDAILTLTQVDYIDEKDPERTAWRMEYVLREFPSKDPYDVFWEYPVHVYDEQMVLLQLPLMTTLSQSNHRKESMANLKKAMTIAQTNAAAKEACTFSHDSTFTLRQFEQAYKKYEPGLDDKTLRARLKEAGYEVVRQPKGLPAIWGSGTQ